MNKKLFILFVILLSIPVSRLSAHLNPPITRINVNKAFFSKPSNDLLFYFHHFVSLNNKPFFSNKFVKVNIYGGTNPYNSGGWNNWNATGTTNVTSGIFNYDDGSSSGISAVLNPSQGVTDNGAAYGGTMCPAEVLRYTTYSTTIRTLTISGLNDSLKYNMEFFASRANTGNSTQFTIGGVNKTVVTDNNLSNSILYTDLTPTNGQIVVTLSRSGTYNYLNGFIITEVSSSSNQPPTVNAGLDQTITLPASSVTLNGSGNDPDGTITAYAWTKISGPSSGSFSSISTATTTVSGLEQGTYVFRLTVTDNGGATATDDVTVTVNAEPPANFTEVDPTVSSIIKNIPVGADATTNKFYYWNNGTISRRTLLPSDVQVSGPGLLIGRSGEALGWGAGTEIRTGVNLRYTGNMLDAMVTVNNFSGSSIHISGSAVESITQLGDQIDMVLNAGTSSNAWQLGGNASIDPSLNFLGTIDNQPLVFRTNSTEALRINSLGQVSIGTTDPKTYKLAVNGDAIFTKVKVKQYPWADYVFNSDYQLPTLKEVEDYIKKNKHLPDVPTEKEVQQNGLDVGENQAVLLKKIEELTLYIIEINKKVDKLTEENEMLKKKAGVANQ